MIETISVPERVNVLGVGVSSIDMRDAVKLADSALQTRLRGYVCVTGVHGVMEAQLDDDLRHILNGSFLTTPDGMPMVWIGRLLGHSRMRRVYGPDFMLELCSLSEKKGYRHFLYGGKPGVAQKLAKALHRSYPGAEIVGTYTPPFGPLNSAQDRELALMVNKAKPDVFWVGLSTPKQEIFMARYLEKLDVGLMVGVGAAFDIHIGAIKDSPQWIKAAGLQWVHRLVQEPRRLWRRYLINNPKFIWKICLQLVGARRFDLEP